MPRPFHACVLGLLLLGSCRDTATEKDLVDEFAMRGFVAFIGAGPHDPLWPVLKAGGQRFLHGGSPVDIRFFTPSSDTPQAQADLLASLNDPDMRGICVQINDPDAVTPIMTRLHTRGMPIVSMVEPLPSAIRFAHVGLDNMAVGRELAKCTIDALGDRGGTIMVLSAGDRHPIYGPRYLAFTEEIRRKSSISVFADVDCHADPAEARRVIAERSRRYPRLDAWVAMEDWPLEDGTPAEKVFQAETRYITCGGVPRQWTLLRNGRSPGIVAADYGQIGRRAAELCVSAIREPAQERRTFYVETRRITPATLDAYQAAWMEWAAKPAGASESVTTQSATAPGDR